MPDMNSNRYLKCYILLHTYISLYIYCTYRDHEKFNLLLEDDLRQKKKKAYFLGSEEYILLSVLSIEVSI